MIFQEPTTSLNPSFTVGFQLMETLRVHEGMDRKAARRRAIELLEQVGIPAPESRLSAYPHQLSGGMNQRVMIAMAIACNPKLLIADEPTTALDVTIQAQILDLLLSLQRDRGMALVLITHDMGVVAETRAARRRDVCGPDHGGARDREPVRRAAASLHGGAAGGAARSASDGGRLATIPGVVPGTVRPAARLPVQPALRLCDAADRARSARSCVRGMDGLIRCHYPLGDATRDARIAADRRAAPARSRARRCHDGLVVAQRSQAHLRGQARLFRASRRSCTRSAASRSTLAAGRTLAVVGESGCGKSTLARLVTMIEQPTAGTLTLDGVDAVDPPASAAKALRRTVQIVFQNPYGSLNPRKQIGAILEEPLVINTDLPKAERRAQALDDDGARSACARSSTRRYPHMFSGGQRQRIAIARALMLQPKLLVADEPVSALDVSVQAQVLNLLIDLQREIGLAYLFISHDLGVVRHIAARRDGHVSRPRGGARAEGAHFRAAAASLHAGAARRDARHRAARASASCRRASCRRRSIRRRAACSRPAAPM